MKRTDRRSLHRRSSSGLLERLQHGTISKHGHRRRRRSSLEDGRCNHLVFVGGARGRLEERRLMDRNYEMKLIDVWVVSGRFSFLLLLALLVALHL